MTKLASKITRCFLGVLWVSQCLDATDKGDYQQLYVKDGVAYYKNSVSGEDSMSYPVSDTLSKTVEQSYTVTSEYERPVWLLEEAQEGARILADAQAGQFLRGREEPYVSKKGLKKSAPAPAPVDDTLHFEDVGMTSDGTILQFYTATPAYLKKSQKPAQEFHQVPYSGYPEYTQPQTGPVSYGAQPYAQYQPRQIPTPYTAGYYSAPPRKMMSQEVDAQSGDQEKLVAEGTMSNISLKCLACGTFNKTHSHSCHECPPVREYKPPPVEEPVIRQFVEVITEPSEESCVPCCPNFCCRCVMSTCNSLLAMCQTVDGRCMPVHYQPAQAVTQESRVAQTEAGGNRCMPCSSPCGQRYEYDCASLEGVDYLKPPAPPAQSRFCHCPPGYMPQKEVPYGYITLEESEKKPVVYAEVMAPAMPRRAEGLATIEGIPTCTIDSEFLKVATLESAIGTLDEKYSCPTNFEKCATVDGAGKILVLCQSVDKDDDLRLVSEGGELEVLGVDTAAKPAQESQTLLVSEEQLSQIKASSKEDKAISVSSEENKDKQPNQPEMIIPINPLPGSSDEQRTKTREAMKDDLTKRDMIKDLIRPIDVSDLIKAKDEETKDSTLVKKDSDSQIDETKNLFEHTPLYFPEGTQTFKPPGATKIFDTARLDLMGHLMDIPVELASDYEPERAHHKLRAVYQYCDSDGLVGSTQLDHCRRDVVAEHGKVQGQ